ncbi:hypothetical protein [Methanococcus maripaludis]|jgi:hypothetical protein|uniref:hypothetical protein n=1 Tax=Methanococcus maripaludis TaxID=39152 RepID=UPI00241E9EB3|nr:hypothetical protein [Methanococcus maripaludis]
MAKPETGELNRFQLNLLSAFEGSVLSLDEIEKLYIEHKLKHYGEDRESVKELIFDLEKGFFKLNDEVIKEYVEILYNVYNSPCKESIDRYEMILEDMVLKRLKNIWKSWKSQHISQKWVMDII